jgi:hypothetical protein
MKLDRRRTTIACATAVIAVGAPIGAAAFVRARTHELAQRIGAAAGVPVELGEIDADLTGTLRLSDVVLGSLFSADRVEASVALESLLAGHFSADEIRVAGPRIAVDVDRDGDSDLARVVRRLAELRKKSGPSSARSTRVRRIVVSSGTLKARVAGLGEVSADAVELVPDENGVRVITGKLRVRGKAAGVAGELVLGRSAAEVALPNVKFGRVLAVGGTGTLTIGSQKIALRDVGVGRLSAGGALEARGYLDDHGVPRAVGAELIPPRDNDSFALTVHGDRIPLAPFAAVAPRALLVEHARVSGELTVRRAARSYELDVDGSIGGLRLDHKTVAPQSIPIDAELDARLTVSPDAFGIAHANLIVGAAKWSLSGWLGRSTPLAGQLDVALAPAACADLLTSLPHEIRGPLDGLTMTGTFSGKARLALDLAAPQGDGVTLATDLANACTVTAEPPGADVTALLRASEHVFPDGSRAIVGPEEAAYFPLKRLPRFVIGAFTSAEDGRFFDHHGFDVNAIAKSFEVDLRDRRLARGGSTISQQLVKNAFLTHRRSLDRKIQEAVLTWRLESRLDKKQILERYLNVIELGPRTFGLRAAAAYWFGISPRELNLKQAAFLAALTAEPTNMSRRVRRHGGLDPDSAARVDLILRAMTRDGLISRDDLEEARERSLNFAASALRSES